MKTHVMSIAALALVAAGSLLYSTAQAAPARPSLAVKAEKPAIGPHGPDCLSLVTYRENIYTPGYMYIAEHTTHIPDDGTWNGQGGSHVFDSDDEARQHVLGLIAYWCTQGSGYGGVDPYCNTAIRVQDDPGTEIPLFPTPRTIRC